MSKKLKVLISVLVVALLLTVGTTVTVMAEGEEETAPPAEEAGEKGLLERVADILGIEREDLINAFKQAQQEMMSDAFIDHLNQAVEEGHITREQANEIIKWWELRPDDTIREWWELKPEVIKPGMFRNALRSRISSRFHMRNGSRERFCPRLSW